MSTRHQYYNQENLFFITTTTKDWINIFKIDSCKKVIVDSLKFCITKYTVDILAYVLMPNHIHMILYFKKDTKLSDFMRDFKKFTSRNIRLELQKANYLDILKLLEFQKGEQTYKVWQDRYDAKIIKGNDMLLTKINYIHNNPVKNGLVQKVEDWTSSSAGFYNGMECELPIKNAGEIM